MDDNIPYHIKVFGVASAEFCEAVELIIYRFFPDITEQQIRKTPSRNAKYLAFTITVNADQKTVTECYRALHAHPQVLMIL